MAMALGALALLWVLSGRRTASSSSGRPAAGQSAMPAAGAPAVPLAGHLWVNPLPALLKSDGTLYKPVVSDPFGLTKRGGRGHLGVDMLWKRKRSTDVPQFQPGTRDGTPLFFAPPAVPVLAAGAGRIVSAKRTERGYGIVIAHTGRGRWTFYQHLDQPARDWQTGDEVAMGQELGTMGYSPDGDAVRHLHFELWVWDAAAKKRGKVDPAPELARWPVIRQHLLR